MLEITTCPDCDKKLKLPDDLVGKKVRCPGCRVKFTARPDSIPEEEPADRSSSRSEGYAVRRDDRDNRDGRYDGPSFRARDRDEYDDRPSRRDDHDRCDRSSRRWDQIKGWRGTRMGVFLVVISNWVFLGGLGVLILGGGVLMLAGASLFSSAASSPFDAGTGAGLFGLAGGAFVLFAIVGLAMLASTILQLIGQGLCMQAPTRRTSNALRIVAIATFACACLAVLLDGSNYAFIGQRGVYGLNGLAHTAAFVLWVVFLRMVALECRNHELAGRLITFLISTFAFGLVSAGLFVFLVCGGALAISGARAPGEAAGTAGAMGILFLVLMLVIGLFYVAFLVWYGLLMQQVREEITRHLARL
jgi:hypothetical protein